LEKKERRKNKMRKNAKMTTTVFLSAVIVVSVLAAISVDFASAASPATLYPIADSYVFNNNPNTNYGTAGTLVVRYNSGGQHENETAFLKFDLSVLPEGAVITQAYLHLLKSGAGTPNFDAYAVADDSWTETGITFNNQPTVGASKSTIFSEGSNWYRWDITTYAAAEFGTSNKLLSIEIKATTSLNIAFLSRETTGTASDPYLVITYTTTATRLTVSCSPDTTTRYGSGSTVISGSLTKTSDGSGIAGKTINLYYNGNNFIGSTTTADGTGPDPIGTYKFTWNNVPASDVNTFYAITAKFAATGAYLASEKTTTNSPGGGGLFVIPEYLFGGLAALGACLIGFVAFKKRSSLPHFKRL
jgi:hypothetical protein